MSYYTLSYDGATYVDGDRVSVYKWVKVHVSQVQRGSEKLILLPEHKTGEFVKYEIEGKNVTFKVLGNGNLRELSSDEEETTSFSVRI